MFLRQPTGGEFKAMGREKHAVDQVYRLISLMCCLPDAVIEDSMDFDDLQLLTEVLAAFLSRSRRTGAQLYAELGLNFGWSYTELMALSIEDAMWWRERLSEIQA